MATHPILISPTETIPYSSHARSQNFLSLHDIYFDSGHKAWKWLKLFGVIQTCLKFQRSLTDLIAEFNTSKFLKKPAVIKKVSFRLSSPFPPHWKLFLRCFNMFIAFNSFVYTLLGIAFPWCKVFEIVKVGSSMYPVSRAFFPVCFLSCTRHSHGRHSRCLACLHSHILRA